MDYAFAPGQSDFDKILKEVIKLRRPDGELKPNTYLVSESGTLQGFFKEITSGIPPRITLPAGDFVLISHASSNGWLEMPMSDNVRDDIQYQALDKKIKKDINIPTEILKNPDGSFKPTRVIIKGCNIGIAQPFLALLKQALQSPDIVVTVTAPKYFQGGIEWTSLGNIVGGIDYLSYAFESYSLTEFRKKSQVIKLLKDDKHLYFDGSEVPPDNWKKWVPERIPKGEEIKSKFLTTLPPAWDVVDSEGDINGGLVFKLEEQVSGPWGFANTKGDKKSYIREHLAAISPEFGNHPWPIWKRYFKTPHSVFNSLEEFVDGFNWKFHVDFNSWFGTRFIYRCVVPITKPIGSKILLGNFYPRAEKAAHVDLGETDATFFETV